MSHAASLPGLAVLATGLLLFAATLVALRWRRPVERGSRRDAASLVGIGIQGLGGVIAASGPVRATLDPLGAAALAQAAVTGLLLVTALTLFVRATVTMGRNWSLVARTRADHALVTTGPFARMRHPIYTALALVVIALAVALGHLPRLALALPVYALGTWLRIRIEERLLHAMFGATYEAYAARVKRFVPGLI
jgi:protein-S-isoprenylcysteine O-methyltransferase Ste14